MKKFCKKGHELKEGNVYIFASGYGTCRICALKRVSLHRFANKARVDAKTMEWIAKNREKHRKYSQKWYSSVEGREYCRKYTKNRLATDLNFRLARVLRDRLRDALKKNQKTGSAVRDLGCTIPELKTHLEKQFKDGMNWENWSFRGWHIDHIKPLNGFDLTDREQLLQAVHYTNLQPLWAKDNLIKGCR